MGVRRPPLRSGRARAARRALGVAVGACLAALAGAAQAVDTGHLAWLHDLPPRPAERPTPTPVAWYDAVDVAIGVLGASDGRLGADVSVRLRLDATDYLARAAADRDDLATLDDAMARQAWHQAQLEWLQDRCVGAWRAHQVALLEGVATPGAALDDELDLVARLLALQATTPADARTVAGCRLDDRPTSRSLADDHPILVGRAAEARLNERSATMLVATPPPSLWLHGDVGIDRFGARANVRLGLDVPLPVTVGDAEAALTTGGRDLELRVRWQRAGAAAPRSFTRDARERADERTALEVALLRRQLEAQLDRLDADRHWHALCGDADATTVVTCLGGVRGDPRWLDAALAAIDAEIAALRSAFAAVDASGHPLVGADGEP